MLATPHGVRPLVVSWYFAVSAAGVVPVLEYYGTVYPSTAVRVADRSDTPGRTVAIYTCQFLPHHSKFH